MQNDPIISQQPKYVTNPDTDPSPRVPLTTDYTIPTIDEHHQHAQQALQMKAQPPTKKMVKFAKPDCPQNKLIPEAIDIPLTNPNPSLRHPNHNIQYASGFKVYAYNTLTKRAIDITAESYAKEL